MNETLSQPEAYSNNPEKIKPPLDCYEVDENTFAVVAPGEHQFLYTEGLFDCKAIVLRNPETQKTLMAHLSCTVDLEAATKKWVKSISSSEAPIEVLICTGSNFDAENDIDSPVFDEPDLSYPSLVSITDQLQKQLAQNTQMASFTVNSLDTDTPRGIAIDLTTGQCYEVDVMAGNGEEGDTSRNQIIESSLE